MRKNLNTLKQEKGITLIALVITIIILIILATIAIRGAVGDNGLVGWAKEARDKTKQGEEDEDKAMSDLDKYIEDQTKEPEDSNQDFPTPPGGSTTEEGIPIPNGFVYVGGTKNDGVIISDNSEDANKGVSHEIAQKLQGNQFVWVPIEDLSTMFAEETVTLSKSILGEAETITDIYSKLRIREEDKETLGFIEGKPGSETSAREPDICSDSEEYGDAVTGISDRGIEQIKSVFKYTGTDAEVLKQFAQANADEYKEMYESAKKYKGFYIGRYELSGTIDTPKSKAGTALIMGVVDSRFIYDWYDLKKACMAIIQGKENTKSTMIYGNQWDETMNWLITSGAKTSDDVNKNSSSWGNYIGTGDGKTGSQEKWSANHIYDLAGNYFENTQETAYNSYRVLRGRL